MMKPMPRLRGAQDLYVPTEQQVQREVVKYLEMSPFYRGWYFHVPNERSHQRQAWALAKAGVKSGIPDLLVIRPNGGFVGLALELKREKAAPSAVTATQRGWLRQFEQAGWRAEVARGTTEAINVLTDYARC